MTSAPSRHVISYTGPISRRVSVNPLQHLTHRHLCAPRRLHTVSNNVRASQCASAGIQCLIDCSTTWMRQCLGPPSPSVNSVSLLSAHHEQKESADGSTRVAMHEVAIGSIASCIHLLLGADCPAADCSRVPCRQRPWQRLSSMEQAFIACNKWRDSIMMQEDW